MILNKSYARSEPEPPNPNGNFEGFSNPISTISIKSLNDFDATHLAGTELNKFFKDDFFNDTIYNHDFNWKNAYALIPDGFKIQNFEKPSLDSIHNLVIMVKLSDEKTFIDTLISVNLNKTFLIQ